LIYYIEKYTVYRWWNFWVLC